MTQPQPMPRDPKSNLSPKLRFPTFSKATGWAKQKIGRILAESRIPSSKNDPARRITVRLYVQGVERREYRGTESTYATNHFIRKAGQFIYGKQNIHKGAFGIIPPHLDGFETSQDLPAFDFSSDCCPQWLLYYLSREQVYSSLEEKMTGTGSKRLNEKIFLSLEMFAPSLKEQQSVAECLSTLEELIGAESQKLEALKAHKKGLMQQLFPSEGETLPRLRFTEFHSTPEWDVKPLEQVATYENGKAHENNISDNGQYIVVNSKFISTQGEVRKYSNDAFCMAEFGDVLMVLSDVPNGKAIAKCYYVEADNLYTVNQRICKIKPTGIDGKFLFNVLDRNAFFLAFDDGVKQTNLRKEDVLNCPICFPRLPEEQKKIGDLVSSVSELITAHGRRLEALKNHKKGLMQQLFPSPTEAEA